jgi:hypothetical protein
VFARPSTEGTITARKYMETSTVLKEFAAATGRQDSVESKVSS